MATVAAVGLMYGPSVETDDAPLGLPILLCLGSTLSVALHMALQLVGAAWVGLRCSRACGAGLIHSPWRSPAGSVGRSSSRRARSPHTSPCLALAATVPGGVLVLQMAYAVYSLPVALGGRADGGAARAFRRGGQSDRSVFADKAREGIAYAFIAGLPPLFLLAVFASPIADILANGQLRVGDLIQALAGCLVVLAVAQLAAGLHEVGREALFARLDVRGPRIAALLALGVTLAGVC